VDASGNVGAVQLFDWWLDTVPPLSPSIVDPPNAVTLTASITFKLQLTGDNSPGQVTFVYTVTPPVDGSEGRMPLTAVPSVPVPNSAPVLLTVTAPTSGVSYTLRVWSVDQGGLISADPTPFAWTYIAKGTLDPGASSSFFLSCFALAGHCYFLHGSYT
jgi:hypothetical protein